MTNSRHAFTLVELSIVLVILGLLVGGVLTGQSLIHAAELRSVTTQYNSYVTAINTFRDKYFAIPGDMTNATAFWGVAAGTGTDATCAAFASTTSATCNGNGDGQINQTNGIYEDMRIWQHLANAGLIEGRFTGTYGTPTYSVDTNTPRSKITGATWYPWYFGTTAASTSMFAGNYGNVMQFAGITSTNRVAITPTDAWNIDTKTDDGVPGTGRVIAWKGSATDSCTSVANSVTDAGATYSLSNTVIACRLFFANAF